MHDHVDVGVGLLGDRLPADWAFGLPDVGLAVDDLALQVGLVDLVELRDAERADARRGQVEQRRAAQAAGADDEHLGVLEALLPGHADVGDDQVPAVAAYLVDGQLGRAPRAEGRTRMLHQRFVGGLRGQRRRPPGCSLLPSSPLPGAPTAPRVPSSGRPAVTGRLPFAGRPAPSLEAEEHTERWSVRRRPARPRGAHAAPGAPGAAARVGPRGLRRAGLPRRRRWTTSPSAPGSPSRCSTSTSPASSTSTSRCSTPPATRSSTTAARPGVHPRQQAARRGHHGRLLRVRRRRHRRVPAGLRVRPDQRARRPRARRPGHHRVRRDDRRGDPRGHRPARRGVAAARRVPGGNGPGQRAVLAVRGEASASARPTPPPSSPASPGAASAATRSPTSTDDVTEGEGPWRSRSACSTPPASSCWRPTRPSTTSRSRSPTGQDTRPTRGPRGGQDRRPARLAYVEIGGGVTTESARERPRSWWPIGGRQARGAALALSDAKGSSAPGHRPLLASSRPGRTTSRRGSRRGSAACSSGNGRLRRLGQHARLDWWRHTWQVVVAAVLDATARLEA